MVSQLFAAPIEVTGVPGVDKTELTFYRDYGKIVRFLGYLNDTTLDVGYCFDDLVYCWLITTQANDQSLRGVGGPLTNPNVEWPSFSWGSAMFALVVGALSAVAITATVVSVKQWRKSRATKRIALAEQKFNDAQAAYLEKPTDKTAAKNFVKANRKLGRAWNRAGSAGLASYNGFSTGSSTATIPEYTSLSDAQSSADQDEESIVPQTPDLSAVITLIQGT